MSRAKQNDAADTQDAADTDESTLRSMRFAVARTTPLAVNLRNGDTDFFVENNLAIDSKLPQQPGRHFSEWAGELISRERDLAAIGEQMSQGNLLYRDIWDSVSPLSALVYWSIDRVFGRSPIILHGAATLVSLFQIAYFNYLTNTRDVYPDRSFWPLQTQLTHFSSTGGSRTPQNRGIRKPRHWEHNEDTY